MPTRPLRSVVAAALRAHIEKLDFDSLKSGQEDAFFVADLGEVYRQHKRWMKALPRIEPHYGRSDKAITLSNESSADTFSCQMQWRSPSASTSCFPGPWIRLCFRCGDPDDIGMGVDASRIIYAHACKSSASIRSAREKSVSQMTFDNAEELYKIQRFFPSVELYVRITTDDSCSIGHLSNKFGAPLNAACPLLELAKKLNLNVVGVAFHVGSLNTNPDAFQKAVLDSRRLFEHGEVIGCRLHTLDVGGGFVHDTFEHTASVLLSALDTYFASPNIRIIAEPGRFYVSSAYTLACNIIARRRVVDQSRESYMLYLNDGIYGNFWGIVYHQTRFVPQVLRCGMDFLPNAESEKKAHLNAELPRYSIWGPTCDGTDCIMKEITFPQVLDANDWLFFQNAGAYTRSATRNFNGFTGKHQVVHVCDEPEVQKILQPE